MIQAKTYYCGRSGGVRKLIDLTGAWIDVSLPPSIPSAASGDLFDIEVDPNNGDHVIVVGDGYCNEFHPNWYGIAVSIDGGVTWQIPGGDYTNIFLAGTCVYKWVEVTVVDSLNIFVCGINDPLSNKGLVAKSTDGGLTFNLCTPLPSIVDGMDVNSIHFVTPLIGVIGLTDYVIKTIDGGVTWTILNGGQPLSTGNPFPNIPLNVGVITGIHINSAAAGNSYRITGVGPNFAFHSIGDGFAVDDWEKDFYPPADGFTNPDGYHLAWLRDITNLTANEYFFVTGLNGLRIRTVTVGNSSWNTLGMGTGALGTSPTIAAHFYNENIGVPQGFYSKGGSVFHNINGFSPNITDEILSDVSPFSVNAIWTWYVDTPPQTCYTVTDCNNVSFITNTDLSAQVASGQYFTIVGYSGCFHAAVATNCSGAIPITLTGAVFTDCVQCNEPPPPPVRCWTIQTCTGGNIFYTNTNLTTIALPGSAFTLIGYFGCFFLAGDAPTCNNSVPVTIDTLYPPGTQTTIGGCTACQNPPPQCYLLHDCSNTLPDIVTNSDLGTYVGQTIKVAIHPGVCWRVSLSSSCTGSVPLNSIITASYPDCISCTQICYILSDCSNSFPQILTNTNLSAYLNKTVTLNTYPGICWSVVQAPDCTGSIPLTATITSNFADCSSCLQKCYTLTDCKGVAPVIITNTDLSLQVGKVIKITKSGCNNVCYIVSGPSTCNSPVVVVLDSSYATCELCNPPPPPLPIPPLKTRRLQPNYGNDEGGCSIDIIENVNCRFAAQVYNRVLQNKYGINTCIEDDYDKYIIKKELLGLNLIFDPNACQVPLVPVVCEVIPVVPPTPIGCAIPTGVSVSIVFPPPPIPPCTVPVVGTVEIVYQT